MSAHIDYFDRYSTAQTTPEEWLPAVARLTQYANKIAMRTDLSLTIGPGVGLGSPACFIPSRAEVQIDTTICLPGADPGSIDPSDKLWRLEHSVFMGAGSHEFAHCAHTRWTPEDFTSVGAGPKIIDTLMILEEARCESALIARAPGQKLFLRSTALELILKEFEIPKTPYGAAAACGLILGRVEGGSLEKKDGLAVYLEASAVLGLKFERLEELWKEFITIGDRNIPSMYSVARRWLEILGEDPSNSDGLLMNLQAPGEGDTKPQLEGSGKAPGEAEVDTGWLKSEIGSAAVAVEGIIIEARAGERARREMAAAGADAERREKATKVSSDAWEPLANDSTQPPTAGWRGEREPTEDERRAATELSERLMQAEQSEIPDIGRSTRVRPPGRLRSREAAQAAAYKELGLRGRPELFRAKQLSPEQRSALSIALMLDISGSMEKAEKAISSTHWVLSHAASRVNATVAAVHFGAKVHGVARPGQIHEQVQLYDCSDPWENFSEAALAVDHVLNLLDGPGTRVLIIGSDGQYRKDYQQKFAEAFMTLCKQKGVVVLWCQFTRRMVGNYGHGALLDMQEATPVEVAEAVGRTIIRAIDSSGRS